MRSRVTRVAGFIPTNFQLLVAFRSRLRVRHGTDSQTGRQITALNGGGHNKLYTLLTDYVEEHWKVSCGSGYFA